MIVITDFMRSTVPAGGDTIYVEYPDAFFFL